jgi:hypothetical protein
MNKQIGKELFSGQSMLLGGLTNEKELIKLCPEKFKYRNPWSDYATQLFFKGGSISDWKWKTSNQSEKEQQLEFLQGILSSLFISQEDKEAIAGWMLSEMLIDVPKRID